MRRMTFVLAGLVLALLRMEPVTLSTPLATINGRGGSDHDDATAVAVDPMTGSVFVAGRRQATDTTSRFLLVKLSADGAREWEHVVTGSADASFILGATAIAVDPATGSVYATGAVQRTGTGTDVVVVKLDGRSAAKDVLWTRLVDTDGGHDVGTALAVTDDGGVAVASAVTRADGQIDIALTRWGPDGTTVWEQSQILAGATGGQPTAVVLLPGGDLALTGWVSRAGSDADLVLGRFDAATGAKRWLVLSNDAAGNGADLGTALKVASNGDLVVGGATSDRVPVPVFAVLRFSSSDGRLLWHTRIGSIRSGVNALAISDRGDILAAGHLDREQGSAFAVVSLDSDGRELWRYEAVGPHDFLRARDLAIDSRGHVVVTGLGASSSAVGTFALVALEPDGGTVVWERPIFGTTPLFNDGHAIVANPITGGVVAVGVTENLNTSIDFTAVSVVDGTETWRHTLTGAGRRRDRADRGSAVTLVQDDLGVAGSRQISGGGFLGSPLEFSVARVNTGGSVDWVRDLADPAPHLDNQAMAITADGRGNLYAAGTTCSTPTTSCFTVARFGRNGREVWRLTLPGLTAREGRTEARTIVIDPKDGNVIAAGRIQEPTGGAFAVVKIDWQTGTVLWSSVGTPGLEGVAHRALLTPRGTVIVGGELAGRLAVVEFDPTGQEVVRGIVTDTFGHVTGLDVDPRDGSTVVGGLMTERIGNVAIVAKFDAAGTLLWSHRVGLPGFPHETAVAVDPMTGSIAVAGGLENRLVVAVLGPDGTQLWRSETQAGVAHAVAFEAGRVVLAGQFLESGGGIFSLLALDGVTGVETLRRTFGNGNAVDLVVSDDVAVAAGTIQSTAGDFDIAVVREPLP